MSLLEKATLITTPTAHSNGTLHSIKGGSVADFDVVRGSAATRVNAEGLIESVATNIPRIDYTTGEGVVLLEPQSTNLITYSEDFSDASWTKSNSTITSNDAISPDGTQNAALLTDDTSTTFHRVQTNKAVTSGVSYSQSVFIKKGVNRYFYLGTNNFSFWDFTFFDLDNNVFVNTPSGVTTEVEVLSNGWVRLKATKLSNATGSFNFCFGTSDTTATSYTGDSTGKVHIYGAQLEELPYATSYIPTSGAIATRLADLVTGAGDATTFNSTEGVLYVEAAALESGSGLSKRVTISDGTLSNRITISVSDNVISGFVNVNNVTQYSFFESGQSTLSYNKIAVKYKENDFSFFINGTKYDVDTSGSTFAANTLTDISFNDGLGSNNFYGKVKALVVFNEALTDSELECLTTI